MSEVMEKPTLVIFSSKRLIPVAEAIRDNLTFARDGDPGFEVTPWTEGFFRSNEVPLNTFLKNLLCYDAAVVILGADDLRQSTEPGKEQVSVPRDNVVFELGACMSRLGTQKTFIVTPETPEVALPSYFKGVYPLKYQTRDDGNLDAAVGTACRAIRNQFRNLDRNSFYSDLPAQGLAFGYFHNFVNPTYRRLRNAQNPLSLEGDWTPSCGFCIYIVIPPKFWGRNKVDEQLTARKLAKLDLDLLDGRNISVYRARREQPSARLVIYDIPTTLMTSQRVIDKVDAFWGTGEQKFKQQLEKREITNFRRAITDIIAEDRDLSEGCVEVIDMTKFDELVKH
jgi:hypothetical protein